MRIFQDRFANILMIEKNSGDTQKWEEKHLYNRAECKLPRLNSSLFPD